jgi:hypothetical protein
VVEAIRHGHPDAMRAYGLMWRLAPEGLDRVVERTGGPYERYLATAVAMTVSRAAGTEIGDRAALSLVDRVVGVGVDVQPWLRSCEQIVLRSKPLVRRLVDAYLRLDLPRAAADLLFSQAIRTFDPTWWRELVTVVGDRPDRLPGMAFVSSDQWNEDAASEILTELSGIGGYVCTKLAVWLVGFAGQQTKWAQPWRERLMELRAHEDVDIRELAGAVRVV